MMKDGGAGAFRPDRASKRLCETRALVFDLVPLASRREVPPLAFMDDLERISVRIKYIGGVVSRIVFHSCPR